jgi:hypothetical protein
LGALLACGGKSLDVGYDDAKTATFVPSQPVDLGAVRGRCDAPVGPDEPYVTDAAARATLSGRWFLCESSAAAVGPVPDAIEFTADGAWFALVHDVSDVYTRDPTRAGTYHTLKEITCCYPDSWVVELTADEGYYVWFRSNPRQMIWQNLAKGGDPRPTVARFVKG